MSFILKLFKSKVFKNIGLYTVLNFINSAIPFLLLPVLTNLLTKEQYGVIDLFNNTSFILLPLVGLNIASSVIRFYYEKDICEKKLLSTAINFTLLSSACFLGIGLVIFLAGFLKPLFAIIFICAMLYACFSQVSEILLSYYRAIEDPKSFGTFRIIKTLTDLGITVLILLFIYTGWESRLFTAVIVSFVFCIISLVLLLRKELYNFSIDKKLLQQCLVYSTPLIIHSISGYLMSYSDRFIILKNYDLAMVGLYSIAYQIGLVMSFVSNSFNQAWTPMLFKTLSSNSKDAMAKIKKVNLAFCSFLFLAGLILYLFLPFIYKYFIGKDFLLDFRIATIIIIAYCFNGLYKVYVNYMFYYKKTFKLSMYTLGCSILNIVVCWFLVPIYGLIGAAVACLISFFMQFVLVYFDYVRNYKKIISN